MEQKPINQLEFTKVFMTILFLALGGVMIAPFLWMVSTSFSPSQDVFRYPNQWIPSRIVFDHHEQIWSGKASFMPYYFNSIKVSVISAGGAVFLAALAAYAFAKIEFPGRGILFLFSLSMMMIPPQILFVPQFIMFNWMGIYNTHWSLILPGLFTIFGVFMLRQFFLSIPNEISDSAMIDGAGHFRIFFQMMLPLAKPALATFAVLDFSWHWNDYERALVFLIDKSLFTIPLGLQNFVDADHIDYTGMMAACSAGIIPMVILFLIGQKFIIQGIAGSAVKG
ncbi:carbohydrate ABC transporter permease [Paenibacillus radicis (ex Xue et al. 2023)]|uniref:Carbohydrate ABC transporter permease n=1 Tax=Paenibacillus radicis (ex Xue et al. 2023) TaxID=2972489 RepID=A0ABT1YTK0_9BACL|nr:carbohydrate ABC transporter permease [Paenibacillus radicis (ex Xue et al. 2023)]MCR8636504.1 carbohydrate ABC transporter permease [Paenibacillus radicis (ex Xue et al. 2023)]